MNLRNVKSDGKLVDPKLIREHTLFILELHGISVEIVATKSGQVESSKPFVIKDLYLVDPMSWKNPELREFMN